jgi:hypothetical protein
MLEWGENEWNPAGKRARKKTSLVWLIAEYTVSGKKACCCREL